MLGFGHFVFHFVSHLTNSAHFLKEVGDKVREELFLE
jgi:hypothetical protein